MEIKKSELRPIGIFLKLLIESEIKAKPNRAAFHLLSSINEELETLAKDAKSVVEGLGGTLDEQGKVTIDDSKQHELQKELASLQNETVDIKSSYKEQFEILKDFVSNYDGVISSEGTLGYNLFLDVLDKIENKEEK